MANNQMNEYYRRKREMKNDLKSMDEEYDEKYLERKERFKDDQTTYGKIRNVTNEVGRGIFKVLKFIAENK